MRPIPLLLGLLAGGLILTDPKLEPRLQINDTPKTQMVFGVTVEGWKPGTSIGTVKLGTPGQNAPPGADLTGWRY